MSEQVYRALHQLDAGMANAYKKWLPKDPDEEFGLLGAKEILKELIDPDTKSSKAASITLNEAHAFLIFVKHVALSTAAHEYLQKQLLGTVGADGDVVYVAALLEAKATTTVPGKDLAKVLTYEAVKNINFTSPGTKIPYTADHYLAMHRILTEDKIAVHTVMDGFLKEKANVRAIYRSDKDRLIIFGPTDDVNLVMTTVHEVTHAIQDWLNETRHPVTATEADAFIAGTVAVTAQWGKLTKAGPVHQAAEIAAKIVIKGEAKQSNQEWTKAYAEVQSKVGGADGYAHLEDPTRESPDKPGQDEVAIMKRYLEEIRKKREAAPKKP